MNTRDVGRKSERIAVKYLKSRGYKILKTNWTCYAGEIDIVAFRGRLTFVEVKSAFSGLCSPCELFTYRKKINLSRAINKFLLENYQENSQVPDYQLDLLCVRKIPEKEKIVYVDHYQNVLNDF